MTMARLVIFLLGSLFANAASAQQQANPAVLQRVITVLEAQRNQAMNQAAIAEARAAGLADDLAKAQARIKELEPRPEPKEDK